MFVYSSSTYTKFSQNNNKTSLTLSYIYENILIYKIFKWIGVVCCMLLLCIKKEKIKRKLLLVFYSYIYAFSDILRPLNGYY